LFIEETLKNFRLKQRDVLEALLISEETMLLLTEHAPEDASIRVVISRKMGVPRIRLIAPGTPMALDEHLGTVSIDQLGDETENAIRSVMLRSYAESIKYRHSRSENILTIVTGIPERILAAHTVTAIILAVISVLVIRQIFPDTAVQWLSTNLLSPLEGLFISALMCITAPAVFVSIACSMFRFEGFSELGRSGKMVVASYLLTSIAATLIGMFIFCLLRPGKIGVLAMQTEPGSVEGFSVLEILSTLIPPNIVEPFISVNSLQLMLIAITIGSALTMCGKRVRHLRVLLEEMDVLCGKVSSLVMQMVPAVVYCSTANLLLSSHLDVLTSIAELIPVLVAGLSSLLLLYCLILLVVVRLNPIPFFRKYVPNLKNIFLKGSAVAAIPLNMRICRRQLGVPKSICSFSIPLGATINMDGNCMCLTIISLFFVRISGIAFGMNEMVVLMLLVVILSLGAPIAPGTLILCLVTLMSQIGIDISMISMVIGINFILEMLLGMVNSVGDAIVALLVARREETLDLDVYRRI
jgi:Na+/H+-dicarboxylate symporter